MGVALWNLKARGPRSHALNFHNARLHGPFPCIKIMCSMHFTAYNVVCWALRRSLCILIANVWIFLDNGHDLKNVTKNQVFMMVDC